MGQAHETEGWEYNTNENITKDGRIILCEWFNTPLVDNAGNVVGVMSLVQDITERRRMEEALKESESRYRVISRLPGPRLYYRRRQQSYPW